jgi:hypothetical protein
MPPDTPPNFLAKYITLGKTEMAAIRPFPPFFRGFRADQIGEMRKNEILQVGMIRNFRISSMMKSPE